MEKNTKGPSLDSPSGQKALSFPTKSTKKEEKVEIKTVPNGTGFVLEMKNDTNTSEMAKPETLSSPSMENAFGPLRENADWNSRLRPRRKRVFLAYSLSRRILRSENGLIQSAWSF
jgi:hypothetical protein